MGSPRMRTRAGRVEQRLPLDPFFCRYKAIRPKLHGSNYFKGSRQSAQSRSWGPQPKHTTRAEIESAASMLSVTTAHIALNEGLIGVFTFGKLVE